ncbi:oligosaccharide flippase family protein [Verrucosispora sp. WMMD573]|uniref:lipopolysaccharide biosynthesis protein n=1 Tax=Verrucosispora sp. WMMD573 TaxID=3015149 RepID=UPI00248CE502|nr:oligosaccharide flippase family protein [Verrucosispora sp. WMMD573]WBB56780.1 polysaccharide biosynthesis C-terminal domain-containing protein [Verrucosispora sp. WMMD573]
MTPVPGGADRPIPGHPDPQPRRTDARRGDGFLRKSGTFFAGTLLRTLAQGALFVLLAREMALDTYGLFVGVTALIAVVSPFASAGAPSLIMQNHADSPAEWDRHLVRGLFVSTVFGCGATVLVTAAGLAIWGADVGLVDLLCLAFADLVAWRLIEAVAASIQVRGRILLAALVPALLHLCRLAAAVVLAVSPGAIALHDWAVASAVTSTVVCVPVLLGGLRGARPAAMRFAGSLAQARTGMLFAVGLSAQSVYNDSDKVMLSRLSTPENAAIYAAAYRVVDLAYTPARSMSAIAYPRFFQAGRSGPRETLRLARRLLPRFLVFSVPMSLLLIAFAWLMPLVFGTEFAAAIPALQWLSVLLVLKSLHYLAADALSGARMQGRRTVCQIGIGVANALLNLWLIPAYGWQGAIVSSLVCDALLAILLWGCLAVSVRRDPAGTSASARPMERV